MKNCIKNTRRTGNIANTATIRGAAITADRTVGNHRRATRDKNTGRRIAGRVATDRTVVQGGGGII